MVTTAMLLYTTFPQSYDVTPLIQRVVAEGYAACANILPAHRSLYMWEGRLCDETETAILLKTNSTKIEALQAFLCKNHPYSVPCILHGPISGGHAPFLAWLQSLGGDGL
jgi:periplasmic divalent cation tolerance protein